MKEKLQAIREDAISKITASDNLDKLNQIRVEVLGKKGQLTEVLKGMKDVAPEDRPKVGQLVNDTRKIIEEKMEEVKAELQAKAREAKLKAEVIDVTLPAKKNKIGHKHPNTLALEELERIFTGMGYEVVEGPEVEYDHYNFDSLNIPDIHPVFLLRHYIANPEWLPHRHTTFYRPVCFPSVPLAHFAALTV